MDDAGSAGDAHLDQDVWDNVKARQQTLAYETSEPGENALNKRRHPKHLFAGLVKCGCCGGGYMMISKDLLGCATSRNKGTCDNRLNIRRDALEASVLSGLRTNLMEPELFKEFCEEFTREVNRLGLSVARTSSASAKSWNASAETWSERFKPYWMVCPGLSSRTRLATSKPARRN
ncbi:zinc ribbon domain-containing protein [Mesorhizobium sp. M0771]|uniref:zinc ribbon domain-containing protein n=1 Tax=Mesorhizobium sp. M0771 TaxID=2956997 RepID=UPI0033378C29